MKKSGVHAPQYVDEAQKIARVGFNYDLCGAFSIYCKVYFATDACRRWSSYFRLMASNYDRFAPAYWLADNVLDHRLNTRTVYMNFFSRFIYWNMNYHVEHHMFPMVPYHNLPRLHRLIKHDLPEPNHGFVDGLKEVFYALKQQLSDPEYRLIGAPSTAKPYNHHLSDAV